MCRKSSSFLEIGTKKLLLTAAGISSKMANSLLPAIDKSFLVLLFKKELLPFFYV